MEHYWIYIIVAIASLIKGFTGFGFALITLPLLINWYSPKELIPVLILCNLFSSVIIVLQKKERKLVDKQFRTLIIYGAAYTLTGVALFKSISEDLMITILGILFIILSSISLLGIKYNARLTPLTFKIAGAFLGFLTGSVSISGPPLALFLNAAKVDNQQFREIFSWFNITTATIAIISYITLDLLTLETLKITGLFLPILYIGSFLGKRLNH
ncbi:sulfite exporter TauE/SafE family protein [Puteibacter caeruleilacunae]|nr:sulfite exporter TauE/SafE family protein [Puteibacter caeruleilacunae]